MSPERMIALGIGALIFIVILVLVMRLLGAG